MKYKTVGVINLLLGSFYILLGALLNFSVFPKLFTIYEQFETGQNAYKNQRLSFCTHNVPYRISKSLFWYKTFSKK